MSDGLRIQLFNELKKEFENIQDTQLITYAYPRNGETIKINGIVLYKVFRISNPWGNKGVAIHKKLTDAAINLISGKRSKDKKGWIGCALTTYNYDIIKEILIDIVKKIVFAKENNLMPKRTRRPKKKDQHAKEQLLKQVEQHIKEEHHIKEEQEKQRSDRIIPIPKKKRIKNN